MPAPAKANMITNTSPSLEHLLVERGALSTDQLQAAAAKRQMTGGQLRDILLEMGVVSEEELLAAVSLQTGIPHLSLAETAAGLRRVTDCFPLKFMQQYK